MPSYLNATNRFIGSLPPEVIRRGKPVCIRLKTKTVRPNCFAREKDKRANEATADNRCYVQPTVALGQFRLDKRPFCGTLARSKSKYDEAKPHYAT